MRWIAILLLGAISLPEDGNASKGPEEPMWLAFGDLRGHIESCGCDPQTNLGGIERIATLVQREYSANPQALVFNLGNNFSTTPGDGIKDRFIRDGLLLVPTTAYLLNRLELENRHRVGMSPLVLSNHRSLATMPRVLPVVTAGKTKVFGYFWSEKHSRILLRWGPPLEKKLLKADPASLGTYRILLFSGPMAHLQSISESGFFHRIIPSNASPMDQQPGNAEKKDPTSLYPLANTDIQMVPLGGTGVLRGGPLQLTKAPSIRELVSDSPFKTSRSVPFQGLLPGERVTWLTPDFDAGSPLQGLMDRYDEAVSKQFSSDTAKKIAAFAHTPYVGASVCKSCHPQAFAAWQQSSHAQAFSTLKTQEKDRDPNCVKCHVVGFDKNGFLSEKITDHLRGVQCENCHGPRRDHAKDPTQQPNRAAEANGCQSCHHQPHSENFQFSLYWNKIKHS